MRIAVSSGKGGTGKTSFSVILAQHMARSHKIPITYYDCDCEAPNAHLFFESIRLKPVDEVSIPTPRIDLDKCTFCGKCKEICRFNAITILGDKVAMTFPELCHGCRGCFRVCEAGAIEEQPRILGKVLKGRADQDIPVELIQGRLRIGEAMSPPLIKAVLSQGGEATDTGPRVEIVDSPPGTSCPVVASLRGADLAILVSEPTPFGLHDLNIMVEVVKGLRVPFAVVTNKAFDPKNTILEFCTRHGHTYLGSLPFSQEFAERYARGGDIFDLVKNDPHCKEVLCKTVGLISGK